MSRLITLLFGLLLLPRRATARRVDHGSGHLQFRAKGLSLCRHAGCCRLLLGLWARSARASDRQICGVENTCGAKGREPHRTVGSGQWGLSWWSRALTPKFAIAPPVGVLNTLPLFLFFPYSSFLLHPKSFIDLLTATFPCGKFCHLGSSYEYRVHYLSSIKENTGELWLTLVSGTEVNDE